MELTERSKRRIRRRKEVTGVSKQKWFRTGTPQLSFAKTTLAQLQYTKKESRVGTKLYRTQTLNTCKNHFNVFSILIRIITLFFSLNHSFGGVHIEPDRDIE